MCILNWLIILLKIIELDLWLLPLNTPPVFWSEDVSPWYPLIGNTRIRASVGLAGHRDLYLSTYTPFFGGAVVPCFQQAVRLSPDPPSRGRDHYLCDWWGATPRPTALFPQLGSADASHHIPLTVPWLLRKDNLSQSPLPVWGAISHR